MRIVVALGGNALLRRGEHPTAAVQRKNVWAAAEALAPVANAHELVITHGNGPQVGLLALQAAAYEHVRPYPLDVLGAEGEGIIGYQSRAPVGTALRLDIPRARSKYCSMEGATFRIGIDLGGTKIEGLALSRDGAEVARRRIKTPKDYQQTLLAIEGLISFLEEEASAATGIAGLGSVGVGIPGTLSPATRVVMNSNSTWLNGHAFDRDLEAIMGRPIRVMNDANCFTLSEAADGAGKGATVVFGVILGTGVGAGIVVEGQVLEGHQGIGGEWGHNSLPWPSDGEWPGPDCYCGRKGCMETYVSGPGMARDHEEVTGQRLTTREIVSRAAGGDEHAGASYTRYVGRLARGLAAVINVLDPEIVVLGGGMSNSPTLPEDVQRALPPHVFSDHVATRVLRNVHGDSSGVRGAAWLWPVDDY